MLELRGRTAQSGPHATRRSFLRIGSLGLAGLSLPQLLAHRAARGDVGPIPPQRDTAVILFWMAGGPSHIDTYDPKPLAPTIVRGPFDSIDTRVPGLHVCELLPRHARIADKLSVIRSLRHEHSVHDDASHWVQTGFPLFNARPQGQKQPCQGAVVSKLRGPNQPEMPAYACIPEDYRRHMGFYQGATYLGERHNALNAGGDPTHRYRPPEFTLPVDLTATRLQDRRKLLSSLEDLTRNAERSGQLAAMDEMQRQAFELVAGARAREAFDVSRETDVTRARYGLHPWGYSALLARRLVEAGTTFVTINLYEKDVDWWDDHTAIEKNLRARLPPFDQAFCGLIEDLHERGLADRVLVAAFGEFGRAPRIDAQAGRGHWPRAMSAVLSGGGVRGGQIIGATTADGGEPRESPLGPGDLLASIYRVCGIDPESFVHDRQGRPVRILETGQAISELF